MYRVIIVEDDPMVRALHIAHVQKNKQFKVESVFKNGREAMEYIENGAEPDLIILDYFMPIMDGGRFLQALRKNGKTIPVIMITSLDDPGVIQKLCNFGIFDYLLKPFEYERFSMAMEKFLKMKEIAKRGGKIMQEELDLFFRMGEEPREKRLDKGMQSKTLETMVSFLKAHPDETLTAEQIANQLSLSKVTVRRYMGYLVKEGYCENRINYATGGRPSIGYICASGIFDGWEAY